MTGWKGSVGEDMPQDWQRWADLQAKRELTDEEWNEFVELDEKYGIRTSKEYPSDFNIGDRIEIVWPVSPGAKLTAKVTGIEYYDYYKCNIRLIKILEVEIEYIENQHLKIFSEYRTDIRPGAIVKLYDPLETCVFVITKRL